MNKTAKPPEPGFVISLEGVDGCGKTTQINFIAELLRARGREVVTSREPGGTPLGDQIRHLLLCPENNDMHVDTELLLFFAARAQHYHRFIRPAIQAGKLVVTDRFSDASFAYQGGGRGAELSRIQALQEWTLGDFCPRLTLLFDVRPEIGRQRAQHCHADRFDQESPEFLDRVRALYRHLAEQAPQRFRVLDAHRAPHQVQDALRAILAECLP